MMDEEPSETRTQEVESSSLCDDSFGDFTEAAASGSDSENELEQDINSSQQTRDARAGVSSSGVVQEYSCDLEEYLKNTCRDILTGLDAELLTSSLERLSVEDLLKELEPSPSMDPIEQHCGHFLKRHTSLEVTRHPWKGSFFETAMMGRLGLQRIAQANNGDNYLDDALGEVITDL